MSFRGWQRVSVKADDGTLREGIAPLILSASRSTDIPAFYADWLLNRFRAGYVRWVNPFNGVSQFVSLEQVRFVVFWTKNPGHASPLFDYLDSRSIGYYVQITLNDYDRERFEPGVAPLQQRIASFRSLSERLGARRVLWRFDPLIRTSAIDVPELLRRIDNIGGQLCRHTSRLTISFMEHYRKVKRNLHNAGIDARAFTRDEMELLARGLSDLNRPWGLELTACAGEVDLSSCGVARGSCVDGNLVAQLAASDSKLMRFLDRDGSTSLFGSAVRRSLKDPGQRPLCGCIVSKDIGAYDTCPHACTYCYANTSSARAIANWKHSGVGDSLMCPLTT